MKSKKLFVAACAATLGLSAIVGTHAIAEPEKDSKPAAGAPEMKLPPGWTEADMQACMAAATPGKMHERLAKEVGTWTGKNTMWMGPDAGPLTTDATASVTSMLDGRFVKTEWSGQMPGSGPFAGVGINGFDNVTGKFTSVWMDSMGTGMMVGTGELSPDGKTISWACTFNCPITKKPAVMRQVDTWTGENTKTLEMWGADPKSGKEYQMMKIELTKK